MSTKIAIYWWAFNPPTLWHLHVIEQIFKNSDIEKIIIVPDWFRLDKNYKIKEENRNKLIKIFINELNILWYNIEIENYFLEWKNNSDTTTYQVDKYFIKKLWKQPYHIFWTDISWEIEKWSWNPNKYIQKQLKKIFIPRKWYNFNKSNLENYKLIEVDSKSSISSTKVKENINNKEKIDKLVIKKIENYINKNNLYNG
jgi:nicotinate (nicotinamide) nucleotide adenylyltransferase